MMRTIFCAMAMSLCCTFAMGQAQYKVLWSFDHTNGSVPTGSLVSDSAGNLYGTTQTGGVQGTCYGGGCGVVYELSPGADGNWNQVVLYAFCQGGSGFQCPDGGSPQTGVTLDSQGNLYGTTPWGGLHSFCNGSDNGCGVAFELSPPTSPGGAWTYSVLYQFCAIEVNNICQDGDIPSSGLIRDAEGNLYGTTGDGGSEDTGTVFELSPAVNGWMETVLYNFCMSGGTDCTDGAFPDANLIFDRHANLYGTTDSGGNANSLGYGGGTVYRLSPSKTGWNESVLYSFPAPKGRTFNEIGPVSFDSARNLYTTFASWDGRTYSNGGVGRLSRKEGNVRDFVFNGSDGSVPQTGVIVDSNRRVLYGTTMGQIFGYGNVFQIDASGQETVLYDFCQQSECADGYEPGGGLLEDKKGNLYGTTEVGGTTENGVVFELTP